MQRSGNFVRTAMVELAKLPSWRASIHFVRIPWLRSTEWKLCPLPCWPLSLSREPPRRLQERTLRLRRRQCVTDLHTVRDGRKLSIRYLGHSTGRHGQAAQHPETLNNPCRAKRRGRSTVRSPSQRRCPSSSGEGQSPKARACSRPVRSERRGTRQAGTAAGSAGRGCLSSPWRREREACRGRGASGG